MSFPWNKDTFRIIVVNGLSDEDLQTLIRLINENSVTLLNLVEYLECVLNDKDNNVRLKGTKLLTDVLHNITIQLSEKELKAIAIFYKDRLHDHHSFYSTLIQGISSLVRQINISNETTLLIVRELFQTIPCQSQTREDRLTYFEILEYVGCQKTEGKNICKFFN